MVSGYNYIEYYKDAELTGFFNQHGYRISCAYMQVHACVQIPKHVYKMKLTSVR